jgi:hypothetical protein
MPKTNTIVRYTDRDFSTIKESLVNYAKRYYPDTYKDFNEAGFGALMTDYVAYVGDVLSFYMDYQANESFLDSAIEFDNVVRIAKTMGYNFSLNYASQGYVSFYATIPSLVGNQTKINTDYAPIIKKGTIVRTVNDEAFILTEDVNFADPDNQRDVAIIDESTGLVSYYAVRGVGRVMSGKQEVTTIDVGDFERFTKIDIDDSFITEILSVIDTEGNEYFEVDYLSQNVIYKEIVNPNSATDKVSSIMKPVLVSRRFTTEKNSQKTILQFGYGSANNLTADTYGRPENVVVQKFGRPYASSTSFDPTNLIESDKFGIAPSNTTLTIAYLKNDSLNPNASQGALTNIVDMVLEFPASTTNLATIESYVRESVRASNEESIVGSVTVPTVEEVRQRALAAVSAQKRAVTIADYETLTYAMPSSFGAIKRVRATQDKDSFKKNLNLYIISEDSFGKFVESTATLKNNLRTWITRHKMITDTVDILNALIVNVSINFTIVADVNKNKFDVLNGCIMALEDYYDIKFNIGEPLFYGDVFRVLKDVDGVLDVVEVFAKTATGGDYSTSNFSIADNLAADGRSITLKENQVFEIKFFDRDLIGTVL